MSILKTFPNYFLILNQDSSKNVNFSWKNNFTKILVKLIANYTTKISWFFSRFPVRISREIGYFFPFPTGNSKHRKWATLVITSENNEFITSGRIKYWTKSLVYSLLTRVAHFLCFEFPVGNGEKPHFPGNSRRKTGKNLKFFVLSLFAIHSNTFHEIFCKLYLTQNICEFEVSFSQKVDIFRGISCFKTRSLI